ncbi:hypothetical protein Syn7502_02734 [Synechococcus sp. PCC 7502]|uniref:hypothetical protein n=1 Tax=Synechococcus sp. PCC 7502 TaxID=1173263 RepID=UPI00029F84A2|nr:hypothetical protein [Synechococcus sp. PCC 7502]AFY74681.1 hypothetical protein Syn7502_02734 [Synechococcus sp. PCC 7502]
MEIIGVIVLVIYIVGAVKFLQGFSNTSFTQNQIPLALLWPLLLAINENYRRNFTKALKGN